MGKSKQKKKNQHERRKMIEEVFKKSKKRVNAEKFDSKTKSAPSNKKFQIIKKVINQLTSETFIRPLIVKQKSSGNFSKDRVASLDKQFDKLRSNKSSGLT